MGAEYELKYRADGEVLTSVRTTFPARWQKIPMETTYYDTPDLKLSMHHWTLRRRMENGVSVCALKTPGEGFGACGEGYFRFSTFGSPEDTQEAAKRLYELLK